MRFYLAEEYQPQCNARFAYYKTQINALLINAKIEHIGASSIPNAISKGDLDIYIAVDQSEFNDAIQKLYRLNFQEKLETLRTDQLCMLESLNGDDVAFQLVVNGSEFESFIKFRDTLRQSSKLVQTYNDLKKRCENLDMIDYRIEKNKFISSVLNQQ
ncbi:GrpB family protein [Acinetobacter sp. ULE_I001]|jgi:GrpB-like predicted nucleotidyltransferase (UPF0157 family)|uniref:GrpB family protein n=1 Tax=unclassified Acinetobacter TaxID=196816 RepID=UPI00301A19DA